MKTIMLKSLFVLLLFTGTVWAQYIPPGGFGQYQGQRLVNNRWITSALFSDYRDACR